MIFRQGVRNFKWSLCFCSSIGESEGQEYAIVEFVGYGNEDTAWLTDLKPSSGALAVKDQKKAAGVSVQIMSLVEQFEIYS